MLGTGGLLTRMRRRLSRESIVAWFREWAAIEEETTALRSFSPLFVPGLLQTEGYARAVLTGSGLLPPEEIEEQVVVRLTRQEILARPKPPLLTAVLDETVLRRPIGSPDVMREQVRHLVKVGNALSRVRIHVVPGSVGAYAGLDGAFVIATDSDGTDIVYHEFRGHIYDLPADVAGEVEIWESIRGEALPHQQSRLRPADEDRPLTTRPGAAYAGKAENLDGAPRNR